MPCRVVVADEARRDLEAALSYLVGTLGARDAARDLLDAFDELIERVEQYPSMYPLVRDARLARGGYRKAALGNYLALYLEKDGIVYIARVFHQSQDYARLV